MLLKSRSNKAHCSDQSRGTVEGGRETGGARVLKGSVKIVLDRAALLNNG